MTARRETRAPSYLRGGSGCGLADAWFDPANIGAFFTQFQADMQKPSFWLAVGKIIWINILLSGDNALVIAMACRGLHGRNRMWGMMIGCRRCGRAADRLHRHRRDPDALPYLKLVGGVALLVIAAKLLVPEDENDEIAAGTTLWHAVRIVVIADIIMSLDNVIAVAAAAQGSRRCWCSASPSPFP